MLAAVFLLAWIWRLLYLQRLSHTVLAGDLTDRFSETTLTEMLMGAYYALMFNWANLENYPLNERALETARFLNESMRAGGGRE